MENEASIKVLLYSDYDYYYMPAGCDVCIKE